MSSDWVVGISKEPIGSPVIFIEGLPGIGNVGKVVADFLIEKSDAELVAEFSSHSLPNSVFINEDNMVELPSIGLYHAHIQGQDYLVMTGDVQPTDEHSSYTFCDELLTLLEKWGVSHIITLGGIGLQDAPEEPQVFTTGNNKEFISSLVDIGANPEVYGVVGPIIGVSGLLLGLAKEVPAATLLAETLGHPMYLGLRGAKSIMQVLMEHFSWDFDLGEIDQEIVQMEEDDQTAHPSPHLQTFKKIKRVRDTNYIG